MNKKLKLKVLESLYAVVPVTLIVLALGMTIVPMELSTLLLFLVGAVFLIVGMGFFTLGADMAMMSIGEQVGTQLTRAKKLWLIVAACFAIGVVITVAEPDLQVLARQTPAVPDLVLILTVAVGVGSFLVLSFLRILFAWNLSWLLIAFYAAVFLLSAFVPDGRVAPLLAELSAELGFSRPGRGIAFTLPLSGVSAAANCLMETDAAHAALPVEREGFPMAESNRFELIVCVAEHGMSGEVMDAARGAGATGGTVLRARGLGGEEAERFLNITIRPEKEVVLILSAAAQKQAIMKAVCAEVFSRTGERGIAFSLPVSDVTGLNLTRLTGQPE